jgi:hypothetical protein
MCADRLARPFEALKPFHRPPTRRVAAGSDYADLAFSL